MPPTGSISRLLRRLQATAIVASVALAACGSTPPPPTGSTPTSSEGLTIPESPPATSPGATAAGTTPTGVTAAGTTVPARQSGWTAAHVELPSDVSGSPSGAPAFCSPCHGTATYLTGVASARFGMVAVGFLQPVVRAAAWLSSDGLTWSAVPALPGAGEGSAMFAATSDGARVVAVGRDGMGAAAWTTTDGTHWLRSTVVAATGSTGAAAGSTAPAIPSAMVAVVAYRSGFVAAGYSEDVAAGTSSAEVWTSPDGLAWTQAATGADDPLARGFPDARISALAVHGSVIVAVGTSGNPSHGPAAAWVSSDGQHWTSAVSSSFGSGAMQGVAASERGFVAVGQASDDRGAAAWTSSDGRAWQAVPDAPSFHFNGLPVRMRAVTSSPDGFVAVGSRSDAGNGSAIAWTSPDGRTWTVDEAPASFSGGEMDAVTAVSAAVSGGSSRGVVAVGESGLPDNASASAWLRIE